MAFDFDAYRAGSRDYSTVFTPDAHTALAGYSWTKSYLLLSTMRDVRSELHTLEPGTWETRETRGFPELAEIGVYYTDPARATRSSPPPAVSRCHRLCCTARPAARWSR